MGVNRRAHHNKLLKAHHINATSPYYEAFEWHTLKVDNKDTSDICAMGCHGSALPLLFPWNSDISGYCNLPRNFHTCLKQNILPSTSKWKRNHVSSVNLLSLEDMADLDTDLLKWWSEQLFLHRTWIQVLGMLSTSSSLLLKTSADFEEPRKEWISSMRRDQTIASPSKSMKYKFRALT